MKFKNKLLILCLLMMILCFCFTISSNAASLDAIRVDTDKSTIHPDQTLTVDVNFGTPLGAFTFDFAYDANLFDFVNASETTTNDNGTRVRVSYYDATGGSNPKSSVSITFKAKSNIITSNPTDIAITAEGLSNSDASVTYDDISTPIIKNVMVEPEYQPYAINLSYTGDILKEQDKDMQLAVTSALGKNYDHVRLVAEVITKPTDATIQLIGKDSANLDHDLIQSGWGDADGYSIGGKDVHQNLMFLGKFSHEGAYTIKINMIDRDNSDTVIATNTFNFDVKTQKQETAPEETTPNEPTIRPETNTTTKVPTTLPKTGINIYAMLGTIMVILTSAYVFITKKEIK